jgi:hypothetical protein
MNITIQIAPISDGEQLLTNLLVQEFGITPVLAQNLYTNRVKPHLDKLKDGCYLLVETFYIDKVYRDSYYHYYSSKLNKYKRDCIRISIFENEIKQDHFRSCKYLEQLDNSYMGFIVLRPTIPSIIGRSLISPKALKDNNFQCTTVKIQSTVNGVKLAVEGFPHSSQDTETITCAETTLWAIMEYFGNKYSEYKPTLPSKIIKSLSNITSERQVPSKGLNITEMSYALRDFGFGTRIYSRSTYNEEFDKLLSSYVESGIPVIIGIDNNPAGTIGHALLCIGHETITNDIIDTIPANNFNDAKLSARFAAKKLTLFDADSINKKFVFVDDNFPVYQKAHLNAPAAHYPVNWHTCKIKNFIVPLYPKIYLEAFEAKKFVINFLSIGPRPLTDNSEVLIKFFLASSRSFKDCLALNDSFDIDIKELVLETPMPKFIWVTELGTKDLLKSKRANGLIILDATEADTRQNKPLIFAAYQGGINKFDYTKGELEDFSLVLPEFTSYEKNLKTLS